MANHTSKIELNIELDENRVPEKLHWTAEDGGISNEEAKAMMLAVWDAKAKETLRIDLWTKDMPVNEMFIMYYQTMIAMANTLERATGHEKLAGALKDYCDFFAKETKIKEA